MRLEVLAVLIAGGLAAVRIFAGLVDTHYQSVLTLRRAINDARRRTQARLLASARLDVS